MVAKVTYGQRIAGVLIYNGIKIDKDEATVLLCHNLPIAPHNGHIDPRRLQEAFRPFFPDTKRGIAEPVFHVSLNPHPLDVLSDEQLIEVAHVYMDRMGYADQPYIIYKHTDISRTHLHIVSSRIRPDRKCVNDRNWKLRSRSATDEIERLYALHPKGHEQATPVAVSKIDYRASNLKAQMASAAVNIVERYKFCSLGEYNTLLELYNLSAQECKGEVAGRKYAGMIYGALDAEGLRVGPPIKASSLSPKVSHRALAGHYGKTKLWLKKNPRRVDLLCRTIRKALRGAQTPEVFSSNLRHAGVEVVFRRSQHAEGRIYGVTFIDRTSGLVINGSRLGKEFAANQFEEHFSRASQLPPQVQPRRSTSPADRAPLQPATNEVKRHLFDSLSTMDFMGELLDEAAQNDQWEQWQRMEQRRKKRRKPKI